MPAIERVLCPVDFSDIAMKGAREAATLARAAGAELLLVHALAEPWLSHAGERGYPAAVAQQYELIARCKLDAMVRALGEAAPRVRAVLAHGPADAAIAQAALSHAADLIVMGTRSRKGLASLLSDNLTDRVMQKTGVPVLRVSPAVVQRRTRFSLIEGPGLA